MNSKIIIVAMFPKRRRDKAVEKIVGYTMDEGGLWIKPRRGERIELTKDGSLLTDITKKHIHSIITEHCRRWNEINLWNDAIIDGN